MVQYDKGFNLAIQQHNSDYIDYSADVLSLSFSRLERSEAEGCNPWCQYYNGRPVDGIVTLY